MKRSEFLKITAVTSVALQLPINAFAATDDTKKLTILHTNDQHSRIEPFEESSAKTSNRGGFARRATLIDTIRSQEKNVLLLDSGDIFQGTPYFNYFGGELEFKLMSKMKYDASTMGNHDFDNGLEGFVKQLPHAKFPFICSNYDFKNTILDGRTQPYKTFVKEGIKVGIFGLGIAFEGLVSKQNYKEAKYLDPIEISQQMTQKLKNEEGCQLIICLSHLGYEYKVEKEKISDLKLAAQTQNIDIILGGHTHTFLDAPTIVTNKANENVIVNQVGWAGLLLGRIDVFFSSTNQRKNFAFQQIPIDDTIA